VRRKFWKSKRGIVGIEAAIVMIAFVVIAAAFAFMVVNMGLLSTQRSQEAIQGGLKEASCPLLIDGSILLKSVNANDIRYVIIPLKVLGTKYVPMWKNETIVSMKVGAHTAFANMYAGLNHDIDPSGKDFDTIINNVTNIKNETFTELVISSNTTTFTLEYAPVASIEALYVNNTLVMQQNEENSTKMSNIGLDDITVDYTTGEITLCFSNLETGTVNATVTYECHNLAVLIVENDDADDSLSFYEKGYLIIVLSESNSLSARDNVVIEIRPEKSAPLTVQFTVPEAIPADSYVTLE